MSDRLGMPQTQNGNQHTAGRAFVQYIWSLVNSQPERGGTAYGVEVAKRFEQFNPALPRVIRSGLDAAHVMKAAIAVGTTTDTVWAAPLADFRALSTEFVSLLSGQTLVGRLQSRMVRAPFRTRTVIETSPATAQFRYENHATPVSSIAFDRALLDSAWCEVITVATNELFSTWSAATEANLRAALLRSISRGVDLAFVDPTLTEQLGGRPGAITAGITPIPSSGTGAANVTSDLLTVLGRLSDSGSDLRNVALLMHPRVALYLAALRYLNGDAPFPAVGVNDGNIWGVPVLTSPAVVSSDSPTSYSIIAVDASKILYADDSVIAADVATHAALQMDSAPSDSAMPMVSLWAHDLVGIKLARQISWRRADESAVQIIDEIAV